MCMHHVGIKIPKLVAILKKKLGGAILLTSGRCNDMFQFSVIKFKIRLIIMEV